jgi:hypothetical protein
MERQQRRRQHGSFQQRQLGEWHSYCRKEVKRVGNKILFYIYWGVLFCQVLFANVISKKKEVVFYILNLQLLR